MRDHDVTALTATELDGARRKLVASLALARPGSPVRVPIVARISAIDAELARRSTPPARQSSTRMTNQPAPEDAARITGVVREHQQWSVFWDPKYHLWRAAEDDPTPTCTPRAPTRPRSWGTSPRTLDPPPRRVSVLWRSAFNCSLSGDRRSGLLELARALEYGLSGRDDRGQRPSLSGISPLWGRRFAASIARGPTSAAAAAHGTPPPAATGLRHHGPDAAPHEED